MDLFFLHNDIATIITVESRSHSARRASIEGVLLYCRDFSILCYSIVILVAFLVFRPVSGALYVVRVEPVELGEFY